MDAGRGSRGSGDAGAGGLQRSERGGVGASDDAGAAWRNMGAPPAPTSPKVRVAAIPQTGKTAIYVLGTDAKNAVSVFASADGGATWTRGGVTPGGRVDGIVAANISGSDGAALYVLADNNQQQVDLHLYVTTDGWRTWARDLDLNTEDVGPSASPWLLGPLPDGGLAIFDNAGIGVPPPYVPPTTNFGAISEWRLDMSAPRTLTNFSNFQLLTQRGSCAS